jgi:hypothetical protein
VKDERARLLHAIDAVDAIQRYTVEGRETFFSDDKTQDAGAQPQKIPVGSWSTSSRRARISVMGPIRS